MTDPLRWVAARRLTSAFHSGSADVFLEIMAEIGAADGWRVAALALNGDVASLAYQVHGAETQQWLDTRIAQMLDRTDERRGDSR